MNTKKITFSLITSALLTTTAFAAAGVGAGNLNLSGGSGTMTTEYSQKYGAVQALNLGNLEYTADILGSGSVSDALIRIDLTDTNLSTTIAGGLVGTVIQNKDTNDTVAKYDRKITVNGRTYFLFDGDATKSIVDGQIYHITTDLNVSIDSSYRLKATDSTVKLDVYSTSGTEEKRDDTSATVLTTKVPQFLVSCLSKFDGLINFETLRDSFVNTTHDNNAVDDSDHYGQSDTLVFTIDNARGAGLYLDGNMTSINFQATKDRDGLVVNHDNNYSRAADWAAGTLLGIKPDGTQYGAGSFAYAENATDANLTFRLPDEVIESGTSTYYATLTHVTGGAGINPTYFTNAHAYIEEGLADNNNTIAPAKNATNQIDVGAWVDYTYIGQIPGAVAHPDLLNKFYITNRSCKSVVPQFKLILDGVVTDVTDVVSKSGKSEVAVDSQEVYNLEDIIAKAGTAATGTYAIEIILPGVAEDFYVYAQSKNIAINQFKDLPVYTTSNRD